MKSGAKNLLQLQPILWSVNVQNIDPQKNKNYIIHQVLSYGDLKQIRSLLHVYSLREVEQVFMKFPKKLYQPAVFHFIKNFILRLKNKKLDERKYVKTVF